MTNDAEEQLDAVRVHLPLLTILNGEAKTGKTTAWHETYSKNPRTKRTSTLSEAEFYLRKGWDVVFDPTGRPYTYEVVDFSVDPERPGGADG